MPAIQSVFKPTATGIGISLRGFRELRKKLHDIPDEVREIQGETVLKGAEIFARKVRQEAPVKTKTLREAVSIRFRWPDEAFVFIAEPAHAYALFTELGTKPHTIRPVVASVLRFEINGQVVFARHVRHPGTKPNPFMKRGFEAGESEVKRIFEQAVRRIAEKLAL